MVAVPERFIGMISGTSMDGVDVAAIDISNGKLSTVLTRTLRYPETLERRLRDAIAPDAVLSLHEWGELNILVGEQFAEAANACIAALDDAVPVIAIGSHGQTLRHHPIGAHPYTLQVGDAATIAARTNHITVADFRSLDVARGGQGAPLVPPFHRACLGGLVDECFVVNIGGIANITALGADPDSTPVAFDTGPGNCLMDEWAQIHLDTSFDTDGAWAGTGQVSQALLDVLLSDRYVQAKPPKSTGREYFNTALLEHALETCGGVRPEPVDVQATLLMFTAQSIANDIERLDASAEAPVYVCGGGARNTALMDKLSDALAPRLVTTTARLGLDPDFIEAAAFAWLAYQRVGGRPVTLATRVPATPMLLGAIYDPRPCAGAIT